MIESPPAAGEVCRAADRFRQAAAGGRPSPGRIQLIPAAASQFHAAQSSYFLSISAWAKANLAVMETLARGRPPFYVRFERLKDEARSAWRQAKETYQSFRRRLGLAAVSRCPGDRLRTHDFQETGIDDWQPEPYTYDFSEVENRIIEPQEDGLKVIADIMMHNRPSARTPARTRTRMARTRPRRSTSRMQRHGAAKPPATRPRIGLSRQRTAATRLLRSNRRTRRPGSTRASASPPRTGARRPIACYDKALEIDPQDETAWFNKGVNLAALGRREEAAECFVRALGIDPQDETAWCAKGVNVDALGQHEEAIGCWDRALQINTHCVAAWCAKGVSLATPGPA